MTNLLYLGNYKNSHDEDQLPVAQIREEAKRFLRLLDSESISFTFQTLNDNRSKKDQTLTRQLHGTLAQHWDQLVELNNKGAGIFVTVNETDGRGRTQENIIAVRAMFQDDDEGFQGTYPLPPSIQVNTSPGKFQRYWLCSDVNEEQFKALQKQVIASYGCDKNVNDLARVLRLPGFLHRKNPEQPYLVRLVEPSPGIVYGAEEVVRAFLGEVRSASGAPAVFSKARQADISVYSATLERARIALSYIPADDREIWLKVGMALNQEFGEAGHPNYGMSGLSARQRNIIKLTKTKPGKVLRLSQAASQLAPSSILP
jgi:hypothetical protein